VAADRHLTTGAYLESIGVPKLAPAITPFDPGYDLHTLVGHLDQSGALMSRLKISMACWIVADEEVTRAKLRAAAERGVPTVSGGGPFEIAAAQGRLPEFLDLCADVGFDRIEAGQGFTTTPLDPVAVVEQAAARGLEVQYELGGKHDGAFTTDVVDGLVRLGTSWLEAGAKELVIEARESARDVGLFGADGTYHAEFAEQLISAFGLEQLVFEAPDKPSQFTLLDHLGQGVQLSNVRLEEVLRVEIYRRGLHSDSFDKPALRPRAPFMELQPDPVAATRP
jgi:phosphosulfolactate synthase